MERWSLWDWTLFICCNRPLESESNLKNEPLYGEIDYSKVKKKANPLIVSNYFEPEYYEKESQNQAIYSSNKKDDINAYDFNELSNLVADKSLKKSNNPHISSFNMDGIRNHLVRKKPGSRHSSGTNLRTPFVERCDKFKVTLRGWLYRLEGSTLKQWKRRWFVLGDYCLFYYKDTKEEKLLGSVLLPSYIISPCHSSEDGITRKFSFKLEHKNMKTYFLAADSKESMNQWMNALSLASIMQFNYSSTFSKNGFSSERNQSEDQDLKMKQVTQASHVLSSTQNANIKNRIDEESGFNSYHSKRSILQPKLMLNSSDKYPGSYNNVGLPPISYPSYFTNNLKSSDFILPHQKRSHYANAPPKPRRSQTNEYLLSSDNTECIYNHPNYRFNQQSRYTISSNAQNDPSFINFSNQSAPDLIAQNLSINSQTHSKQILHPWDQSNQSSNLTSVQSPLNFSAQLQPSNLLYYSVPPINSDKYQFDEPNSFSIHSNFNHLHINNGSRSKLPPRPHSADFLERNHQDEDEMVLIQNNLEPSKLEVSNIMNNSGERNNEILENYSNAKLNPKLINNQTKIMSIRPKSCLERYDPYYLKSFDEHNQEIEYNTKDNKLMASSFNSPPPKPWSDCLRSDLNFRTKEEFFNETFLPTSNSVSNNLANLKPKTSPILNVNGPVKFNRGQRGESIQRLLEWKQRMIQSPLNKRNLVSIKPQSILSENEFDQDGQFGAPQRPPLPKEYQNKMYPLKERKDSFVNDKSVKHLDNVRERSKSFGSSLSTNDVSGSSDDEEQGLIKNSMSQSRIVPKLGNNQQPVQASSINICSEKKRDTNSPEYINVCNVKALKQNNGQPHLLTDPAVIRSGGDGQEAEDGQNLNIKREDYYKASTLFYKPFSKSLQSSLTLKLYNKTIDEMKEKLFNSDWNQVGLTKSEEANQLVSFQLQTDMCSKDQLPLDRKVNNESELSPASSKRLIKTSFAKQDQLEFSKSPFKDEVHFSKIESNNYKDGNNRSLNLENKKVENRLNEKPKDEKLKITENFEFKNVEDESYQEDDVIQKLSKNFQEQKNRPPPNFVKDQVQCFEKNGFEINNSSFWIKSRKDILSDSKKKFDSNLSFFSDSEIFDKCQDNNTDEDSLTTKSAPLTLSPLSSVLADLRKTAELRKERNERRTLKLEKVCKTRETLTESNFLNRNLIKSNSNNQKNQCDTLINKNKISFKNKMVNKSEIDYDNGDEADDEMNREFESLQYQNELHKNTLLPKSTKQLLMSVHKMKTGKQIEDDFGIKKSKLLEFSDNHLSNNYLSNNQSRLELHYNKTIDEIAAFSKSDIVKKNNKSDKDKNDAVSDYYSYSTKTAENNQINNNQAHFTDQGLEKPNPANILDLIPEDYGVKFFDQESGKINHTLSDDHSKVAQTNKVNFKRCLTSDSLAEICDKNKIEEQKKLTKRSKSLEFLSENHLYENIQMFKVYDQNSNGSKLLNPLPNNSYLTKPEVVDAQHSNSNLNSIRIQSEAKLSSIKKEVFDRLYNNEEKCKNFEYLNFQNSNSLNFNDFNSSSMINFKGSENGSIVRQKVKKKENLRNKHSHNDLQNILESETSSFIPPSPPPLPAGYSQPMCSDSFKQNTQNNNKLTQKLSQSLAGDLNLKSRFWSSTNDLMSKSQEELMSLLIKLRREQTIALTNCDKIRSQMELEEKLIEIEPRQKDEHRIRFKELKERLFIAEREFESRFQIISIVDDVLRKNYMKLKSASEYGIQYPLNDKPLSDDFIALKSKAASTSVLDILDVSTSASSSLVPFLEKNNQINQSEYSSSQSKNLKPEKIAKEQERLIQILEQDKKILEKTLAGVVSSLNKLNHSEKETSVLYASDVEKMKQQQQVLEKELSRVQSLLMHSAQKLKERATENAKFEQDIYLSCCQFNPTFVSPISFSDREGSSIVLEEQLANIDQAIDDLNAKRKEILENFRKRDTSLFKSASGPIDSINLIDKKEPSNSQFEELNNSMRKNDDVIIHSDNNEINRSNLELETKMDPGQFKNYKEENLKSNNYNHALSNMSQDQNNFQKFPLSFSKTVRLVKRESDKRKTDQLVKLSFSQSNEEVSNNSNLDENGSNQTTNLDSDINSKCSNELRTIKSASIKNPESPSIIKSNLSNLMEFNDQNFFEIGCPKKIDIPQRYVPEKDDNYLSKEEKNRRSIKAQSICKMLTESAYSDYGSIHRRSLSSASCSSSVYNFEGNVKTQTSLRKSSSFNDVNKLEASLLSKDVKVIFEKEKKKRAQLLLLNSVIAKEVTEKSRLLNS